MSKNQNPLDLLRKYRPVRYANDEAAWRQPAVDAEADRLRAAVAEGIEPDPIDEQARRNMAVAERNDCRKAHNFLREIGRTGQWPLFYDDDLAAFPILIYGNDAVPDRKVRMEVCAVADFIGWELSMRRKNDASTRRMLDEVAGSALIVQWMSEQAVGTWAQIDKGAIPTNHELHDDE